MKKQMTENSKNKIPNSNNGITLIALVITIIVMLILVSVTISMAINGGLFEKAGEAVSDTKNAIDKEQILANGRVQIGGIWYDSIDDYIKGIESEDQSGTTTGGTPGEENPEGGEGNQGGTGGEGSGNTMLSYDQTSKDANGMLTANATYTSGDYTAVIPKGFKISDVEGEKEITNGLVIKDANNNEFVWIPVTEDIGTAYDSDGNGDNNTGYYEPKELTGEYSSSTLTPKSKYDSQDILNELYPTNYYKFTTGMYASEYAQMVEKVNEHNGFYIGRYETTIDSDGNIGSKYNTPVLTTGKTFTKEGTSYKYRWYGLYNEQKTADVSGNGTDVQTAMIYGVLWDKTMNFIKGQFDLGNTSAYDVTTKHNTWHGSANGHTGVVNSAQANTGDVALNIWDLESNAFELTQEANSSYYRVRRGGGCSNSDKASNRNCNYPTDIVTFNSSRLALYITNE